jgi:hypothetical protein
MARIKLGTIATHTHSAPDELPVDHHPREINTIVHNLTTLSHCR